MAIKTSKTLSFCGNLFKGSLRKLIAEILKNERSRSFFFFNIQHYVYFWQNKSLSRPDIFVVNDSRVFNILWQLLGNSFSLIPGWDFLPLFLRRAAFSKKKLYFLLTNDKKDTFSFLQNFLKKNFPSLYSRIEGQTIPYRQVVKGSFDSKEIITQINKSGADIVLVGWGAPFGQNWILKNRKKIKAHSVIEIGGAVDFLLGFKKRPPDFLIKLGLGWFWRLLKEPWLWRRYFLHDIQILRYFIIDIVWKFKKHK
ncbi:WecB/TagA/CpsF family glycosyltransferase [bacterium]|nr:WecB/TagA/CpsF family glycosyltransferase [bacterium]